jgi:hypothetical protein
MSNNRDKRIDEDRDFINSPKYNNSLKKLLDEHPDGVSDSVICRVLKIEETELESIYLKALMKLKQSMKS